MLPVDIETVVAAESKKKAKAKALTGGSGRSSMKKTSSDEGAAEKEASPSKNDVGENADESEVGHTSERGFAKYFLPFSQITGWTVSC